MYTPALEWNNNNNHYYYYYYTPFIVGYLGK